MGPALTEGRSFFIVGVGRSGTSLLQSMLAAHSKLAFPPESSFLRRYGAVGRISRMARVSSCSDIVEYLEADSRLQRIDVSLPDVVEAAAQAGPLDDFSVYRSLLSAYAKSVGKPHVGDKDPRLIEYLDILRAAYPAADVIHIIRDPRDVLASKKKADWSRNHGTLRHVFAYRAQINCGRSRGRKLFGPRYHEVVYESLLASPEQELRALCSRLGIDFETAMLEFSDAAKTLVAPDEMGWKQETMGPLLKNNAGKWRNTLSNWEVALVERCCDMAMRQFNYAPSGVSSNLSVGRRAQVLVLSAIVAIAEPVYIGYRRFKHWLSRRKY